MDVHVTQIFRGMDVQVTLTGKRMGAHVTQIGREWTSYKSDRLGGLGGEWSDVPVTY